MSENMLPLIVTVPNEVLPKGWKALRNELFEAMGATPDLYAMYRNEKGLLVTMTKQKEKDGRIWTHVAISYPDRLPSYYDLCDVKRIFLGEESMAYLLFPPKVEHVNIHPNCLHLWSCEEGAVTPDFTWGTGSI